MTDRFILSHICQYMKLNHSATAAELAVQFKVEKQAIYGMLDHLMYKGLVRSEGQPSASPSTKPLMTFAMHSCHTDCGSCDHGCDTDPKNLPERFYWQRR